MSADDSNPLTGWANESPLLLLLCGWPLPPWVLGLELGAAKLGKELSLHSVSRSTLLCSCKGSPSEETHTVPGSRFTFEIQIPDVGLAGPAV